MDASITQIVLALSQQNLELSQEVSRLRTQLAKYENNEIAPEIPKITEVSKRKTLKKQDAEEPVQEKPKKVISEAGHAAHVATGKRVAAINAIRKEFLLDAKFLGEW
jgi:regulator of replication initiation timing